MRRALILASLGFALCVPAAAQETMNAPAPDPAPATAPESAGSAATAKATPAENVDCAISLSYLVGTSQDEKVSAGLSIGLAWFVGLYEGQTGKDINAALKARSEALTPDQLKGFHRPCIDRMVNFANRLETFDD